MKWERRNFMPNDEVRAAIERARISAVNAEISDRDNYETRFLAALIAEDAVMRMMSKAAYDSRYDGNPGLNVRDGWKFVDQEIWISEQRAALLALARECGR